MNFMHLTFKIRSKILSTLKEEKNTFYAGGGGEKITVYAGERGGEN